MWMINVNSEKLPKLVEAIGLGSSLPELNLYACCSSRTTLIYKFPNTESYSWACPSDVNISTVPCLAFSQTIVQGTLRKSPILARGWGNHLELFSVEDTIQAWFPIYEYLGTSEIISLNWVELQKVVFIDKQNIISVFDMSVLDVTESVKYNVVHLLTCPVSTTIINGITPYSSHVSFSTFDGSLYFADENMIYRARVKSNNELIDEYMEKDQYLSAIAICIKVLERGMANRSVVVLSENVITKYLQYISKNEIDQEIIDSSIKSFFEISRISNNWEFLFSKIFTFFQDRKWISHFYDQLQISMHSSSVKKLPIPILQMYIHYMISKDKREKLNYGLLKLDNDILLNSDIIELCLVYELYDPVFHVFNNKNKDFITPLKYLEEKLPNNPGISQIIFKYIKNIFNKQNFLNQPLENNSVFSIWNEMFSLLFNKSSSLSCLYLILDVDLEGTLQFLKNPLNSMDMITKISTMPNGKPLVSNCPTLKRIIEILMMDVSERYSDDKSKIKINSFILPFISNDITLLPLSNVNPFLISLFTQSDLVIEKDEFQNYILNLLKKIDISLFDSENLINISIEKNLSQITALLYKKTGDITQGLLSYINSSDSEVQKQVFQFIYSDLEESTDNTKLKIISIVKKYFLELSNINIGDSILLLLKYFPNSINECIDVLTDDCQFKFLDILFLNCEDEVNLEKISLSITDGIEREIMKYKTKYVSKLFEIYPTKIIPFLVKYPDYDIDRYFQLAKERKLIDVMLYFYKIQEKTFDAYELYKEEFINQFDMFTKQFNNNPNEIPPSTKLMETLEKTISLLSEHLSKLKQINNSNNDWFNILKVIKEKLEIGVKLEKEISDKFNDVWNRIKIGYNVDDIDGIKIHEVFCLNFSNS